MLLLQLSVHAAFDEKDFGDHACVRFHEQVWVSPEQIPQVYWSETLPILRN